MRSDGWQLKYAHSLSMTDKEIYSFLLNLASVDEEIPSLSFKSNFLISLSIKSFNSGL